MITLREIQSKDNLKLAAVLRAVLEEMNVPKVGTAYEDPQLDTMFESYQTKNAIYFVLEKNSKLIGGGGIAPLLGQNDSICELQKMYFLPEARGIGMGNKMILECLKFAAKHYDTCYIETLPNMKKAQELYIKKGFYYIDKSMGATGHSSCNVWMLKDLK